MAKTSLTCCLTLQGIPPAVGAHRLADDPNRQAGTASIGNLHACSFLCRRQPGGSQSCRWAAGEPSIVLGVSLHWIAGVTLHPNCPGSVIAERLLQSSDPVALAQCRMADGTVPASALIRAGGLLDCTQPFNSPGSRHPALPISHTRAKRT